MTDMIKYLPAALRDIEELKALCDANDPDKKEIQEHLNIDTDDFFISSTSDEGVARWENVMGINPPGDASIEERRFKLIAKVNNRVPFTENRIRGILDTITGKGNYDFKMTLDTFYLEVRLHLGTKYNLKTVIELLNNVVPAHIEIYVDLKYNTHDVLRGFTHETLSRYTHTELRDTIITE